MFATEQRESSAPWRGSDGMGAKTCVIEKFEVSRYTLILYTKYRWFSSGIGMLCPVGDSLSVSCLAWWCLELTHMFVHIFDVVVELSTALGHETTHDPLDGKR